DAQTLRAIDEAVVSRERVSNDSSIQSGTSMPVNFANYPDTFISAIDVDLTNLEVTLHWSGTDAATRDSGPFDCSVGRGVPDNGPCFDCDNSTVSNTTSTNCTPK